MQYQPTLPIPTTADGIPGYLSTELQALAKALVQAQDFAYLKTLNVAPTKPREGMVAKADGANWNPGSGAGVYGYIGGAWVKFGGGSGTVTNTPGALTAGLVVIGNGGNDEKVLAASTDGFVLTQAAGVASWAAASGGLSLGLVLGMQTLPMTG